MGIRLLTQEINRLISFLVLQTLYDLWILSLILHIHTANKKHFNFVSHCIFKLCSTMTFRSVFTSGHVHYDI